MAISTAQQIIVLKSPSLSGDSRLDDMVELAKFHLGPSVWGTKYQYALALLVLHWLTLDAQGGGSSSSSGTGAVGGIKSEKEGDLQRSFGGLPSGVSERRAYLMSTTFGQELLQLQAACLMLPRTRLV